MMQGYDQNVEKISENYRDKVKELANIYSAFNKLFPGRAQKGKLEKRLMNDSIWGKFLRTLE